MRLDEIVAFVQPLRRVELQIQRRARIDDEPNAPSLQRSPVPIWITQGGEVARVRDGELATALDELPQPISLPADVQQPNPPVEMLAYYLPFHLHPANWGVYLRESGLLVVASIVRGGVVTMPDAPSIATARQILMEHETFHFHAELACARAEVVAKVRVYDAYFDDGVASAHEEALANAAAFRHLQREPEPTQARVRSWMEHQDPGYRDFHRWLRPAKFTDGLRRSSSYMLRNLPGASLPTREPGEFLFEALRRFRVPTHIVRDVSATDLKPFPKAHGMRVLVHTRDHPPPHIHLQVPPGCDYSRYEWPTLEPLKGNPALTGSQRKALSRYVNKYGAEIDKTVREVYPTVPPWKAS